jgi:cell division protein FtsZ
MNLKISVPEAAISGKPRISVIGVGGAGSNAVNNMIRANLEGVDFIVSNTDAQSLSQSLAEHRIQLGAQLTQGLGAGSQPEVGRAAAEESQDDILNHLQGANMVFITAGMGGGTGTGAAPVIARLAKEQGILTVAVVTRPFNFEGGHRTRLATKGITDLAQSVDTLIIIPNQNLFRVADDQTTFADAFKMADDVLYSGVRSITDLIVKPGLINLDFADIQSVMSDMGKAMMGTGEATGNDRAREAAEEAIANPLLEDASMKGAKGVLINITGGPDMTLFEVDEAAHRIRQEIDPDHVDKATNIIFGSTFSEELEGKVRVSVVATGIDDGDADRTASTSRPLTEPAATTPTNAPLDKPVSPEPSATTDVADKNWINESSPPEEAKRVFYEGVSEVPLAPEPVAETTPLFKPAPTMASVPEKPVVRKKGFFQRFMSMGDDSQSPTKDQAPASSKSGSSQPIMENKITTDALSMSAPLSSPSFTAQSQKPSEPMVSEVSQLLPSENQAKIPADSSVETEGVDSLTVPDATINTAQSSESENLDIPAFLRRKSS